MAISDLINISGLMDDAKCFAFVREKRWPDGARCPGCDSGTVIRGGCDQPLRVWVLCLLFMGLNLSNRQIALELGLSPSDVQAMTEQLRRGLVARVPPVALQGEVEIDEVYVVAGHKGQPTAVAKRGGSGAVAGWQARRDGARWRTTSRPSWA